MGIRELSPELAKKSKKELGEDPDRVLQGIQHIKNWAAKQPHLRARLDDQWLLAFLRGCKFSLERTKEKLDTFYSLRSTFSELAGRKDPMNRIMQDIMEMGVILPLPNRDPLKPRVILIRIGIFDSDKYHVLDPMKVGMMISDLFLLNDDIAVVSGFLHLIDMTNVHFGHFAQVTPSLMKKLAILSQEGFPFRQKGAHFINPPVGLETFINTLKTFLTEKNKSRIHVHNRDNLKSLYKHISKSVLPKEYGGDAGPIQDHIDAWKTRIEHHRDWYLEDNKYGTDECKRRGSPKTSESMFGLDGSFRRLNID